MTRYGLPFVAALALAGTPVRAQTVEELLAKNLEARGGAAKLKSVQSIRMTGHMSVGPGLEAPFVMEMKRPHSMRVEFTIQGMTGVQAYDGQKAWMVMPFMGKTEPEAMPEDATKEAAEEADFDGPLVDAKEKGNLVELVGKDKVAGADAYKLKVTLKGGDVRYLYLSVETFLEVKGESTRKMGATEVQGESLIGDYRNEGGLMIPHSIETSSKGMEQKQRLTIEKVELNASVDDAKFRMPASTPSPVPGRN